MSEKRISEREEADKLANRLLDEPNCDPDDDLRMLSRQLLRRREVLERLEKKLAEMYDPTREMIAANIDTDLRMHREAVTLLRNCLRGIFAKALTGGPSYQAAKHGLAILDALGQFHPMHGESWCGWPKVE